MIHNRSDEQAFFRDFYMPDVYGYILSNLISRNIFSIDAVKSKRLHVMPVF
jgi:hypothetical protein